MTTTSPARTVGRIALGAMLLFAGTSHLTFAREEFAAQVPPWVPVDTDTVVVGSGLVELALGGALVALPKQRVAVGWAGRRVLRRDLPRQHLPAGHPHGRVRAGLGPGARGPARLPAAARRLGALVDGRLEGLAREPGQPRLIAAAIRSASIRSSRNMPLIGLVYPVK